MKRLHRLMLCVALLLHGSTYAQEPPGSAPGKKETKPLLFASLPDSFEVDRNQLQKIFASEVNALISLQLSSQFTIEGKIVDKNQQNPASLTVNLRLSNFDNALMNMSLTLLADNSASIKGRILHPRYRDLLILYKDNNRYFIKKSSQQLYMPE